MMENFYSHTHNQKSILLKKFKKQMAAILLPFFNKLDLLITWLLIDDKFENKKCSIHLYLTFSSYMYIELCTNAKKIQDGCRKCEKRIIFIVVFCDFSPKIF